jgi:uncharacterized protein (TIGR03000 family)
MNRHWFATVVTAALVISLLAAGQSFAQHHGGGGGHSHGGGGGFSHGGHSSFSHGSFSHSNFNHGNFNHGNFHHGNFNHHGFHNGFYGFGFAPFYGYGYGYGYGGYGGYYDPSYYAADYGPTIYYNNYYQPSYPYMPYTNAYTSGTPSSTVQSFYPPNGNGNREAILNIQVPADAEIWVEGEKTKQTGTNRTFRSPPLEPGKNYTYEVKVRWMEDGKPVEKTENVPVHAGEQSRVDFLKRS